MVSVNRPGSDTRMVEIMVSYGRLGLSLTYFSNSETPFCISALELRRQLLTAVDDLEQGHQGHVALFLELDDACRGSRPPPAA